MLENFSDKFDLLYSVDILDEFSKANCLFPIEENTSFSKDVKYYSYLYIHKKENVFDIYARAWDMDDGDLRNPTIFKYNKDGISYHLTLVSIPNLLYRFTNYNLKSYMLPLILAENATCLSDTGKAILELFRSNHNTFYLYYQMLIKGETRKLLQRTYDLIQASDPFFNKENSLALDNEFCQALLKQLSFYSLDGHTQYKANSLINIYKSINKPRIFWDDLKLMYQALKVELAKDLDNMYYISQEICHKYNEAINNLKTITLEHLNA